MSRAKTGPPPAAQVRREPSPPQPVAADGGAIRHLFWLLPAFAAVAVYWGSLDNGFVWDDPLVLQQLRAFRGAGDLLVIPAGVPRLYYRPVVFATYLVDRALGGEQPFWFHASVVAWHVLNTVLVFFFARLLLGAGRSPRAPRSWESLFAGAAALLFAVHPAHVESVAWMAGRSDVIACTFLLGSFLLFLRAGAASPWLAGGSFLLALLTKEPVILAAGVLPLAEWTLGRRVQLARYLPIATAVVLYFVLRIAGAGLLSEPTLAATTGVADAVRALGFYLVNMFLPLSQGVFYEKVPKSAAYLIVGLAGAGLLGGLLFWGWRVRQAAILVSLGWMAATLAPALLLVLRQIASTPIAERYTYIPSAGAVVLASFLLLQLARRMGRHEVALGMAGLLAVAGAVEVVRRNDVWHDDILFWTAAAATNEGSTPQRELADALLRRNRESEAEAAYLAALERPASPEERAMTYGNLGNLYSRGPRVDEGILLFRKAIERRPHPTFYHGLGLALMRKAERAQTAGDQPTLTASVVESREAFERALALGSMPNPPSAFNQWQPAKTHMLLGQVLVALNQRELARQHLQRSLAIEPVGVSADTSRKFLAMIGE